MGAENGRDVPSRGNSMYKSTEAGRAVGTRDMIAGTVLGRPQSEMRLRPGISGGSLALLDRGQRGLKRPRALTATSQFPYTFRAFPKALWLIFASLYPMQLSGLGAQNLEPDCC